MEGASWRGKASWQARDGLLAWLDGQKIQQAPQQQINDKCKTQDVGWGRESML